MTADNERIKAAIGYDPVLVSGHTDGKAWGGRTYRTVDDRDNLVRRLLPVLDQVRTETRKQVAREIFDEEQRAQAVIVKAVDVTDPNYVHLTGRLVGLQRARDVAEGVDL